VHPDCPIIVDETEIPEFVHEEADPGPGRPNHFSGRLLVDLCRDGFGAAFLSKVRQQEERTGKALLTGIQQLIDEVSLDATVTGQKMRRESIRERRLFVQHPQHLRFIDPIERALLQHSGGREPDRLRDQASLAEEVAVAKDAMTASLPLAEVTLSFTLPLWT